MYFEVLENIENGKYSREELLLDIQHDNDVVFCGEWDSKDLELVKSIENVIKYMEGE